MHCYSESLFLNPHKLLVPETKQIIFIQNFSVKYHIQTLSNISNPQNIKDHSIIIKNKFTFLLTSRLIVYLLSFSPSL